MEIVGLVSFYTIYDMIILPFDIVSGILNIIILICFGIGIRHHVKSIDEPVNLALKNNFIWFLIFTGIVSFIVFGSYNIFLK